MELSTTLLIIAALMYSIVLPIIFRLTAYAHRKLFIDHRARRLREKGADRRAIRDLPKRLWPKWREHLAFTMKDQRNFAYGKDKETGEPKTINMTRKQVFYLHWAAGLLVTSIGGLFVNWWIIGFGFIGFFVTISFGINSAKPIIKERKRLLDRMFKVGSKSFFYSSEDAENPQSQVQILDWDDYVTPTKVQYNVPESFGAEGEEAFQRQFNQIFGTQRTWVPSHDEEAKEYGWDYDAGILTLYAVPPLPTMAPWHERYVLSPEIAWSFFPIGLGVEDGVELVNPETGEIEHVLGFDLSGEQAKVGKQTGTKVSGKIVVSPMVLVGGGTGGGKALSEDTMIYVVDDDTAHQYATDSASTEQPQVQTAPIPMVEEATTELRDITTEQREIITIDPTQQNPPEVPSL